jgi:hypothetical protein
MEGIFERKIWWAAAKCSTKGVERVCMQPRSCTCFFQTPDLFYEMDKISPNLRDLATGSNTDHGKSLAYG